VGLICILLSYRGGVNIYSIYIEGWCHIERGGLIYST
jgi:hypothetical protein